MTAVLRRSSEDLHVLLSGVHPPLSPARQISGWQALKRRAAQRERRLHRFHWASLALALSGAALALGIWIGRHSTIEPLKYTTQDLQLSADGQMRAALQGHPQLRFADRSRVELGNGSQARLVSVSQHGARLRLSDGVAKLHLAEPGALGWEVDAGPYTVFANGTELFVNWSGRDQVLEVRAVTGSVEVEGPLANDGIVLRSGQVLTVRQGEIVVRESNATR